MNIALPISGILLILSAVIFLHTVWRYRQHRKQQIPDTMGQSKTFDYGYLATIHTNFIEAYPEPYIQASRLGVTIVIPTTYSGLTQRMPVASGAKWSPGKTSSV